MVFIVEPLLYVFLLQHSSIGSAGNKKTRVWKNLKQIVAAEKALPWGPDDTTCMAYLLYRSMNTFFSCQFIFKIDFSLTSFGW